MHKWIVCCLLGVGAVALAKRTDVGSYAGTLWSQVTSETKRQIPTRFEIDRARHELAQPRQDIAGMIRPLAEHKATPGPARQGPRPDADQPRPIAAIGCSA